ncbi:hypothetical protein RAS12_25715 [Achromobacter seleniivolatilans]|uniref:2-aminoadipate transaminase n=1 Tax=Achromobacter seleniivolatilans TaxID=3047478 RepID=A0ABY9LYW8_9BURK|nr:hypothetical protein [Achromobacter sp. R39]WMD19974.1 hypothetical protein RAS12_25715 [Achromobacter sp. R39]
MRAIDPAGGSTLWLELPSRIDSQLLFKASLDERILIVPGTIFSASGSYRNYIRLNIPATWGAQHSLALQRVGEIASAMLREFKQ